MEKDIYSRRDAESAGISIIYGCDFSCELLIFATKVALTNTCKYLCVLCASAREIIRRISKFSGLVSTRDRTVKNKGKVVTVTWMINPRIAHTLIDTVHQSHSRLFQLSSTNAFDYFINIKVVGQTVT
jgi:hypothetical protein